MQPRPVRSKYEFTRTCALHRLHQIVKSADARCICQHVGIADQLLNYTLVGAPIITETSEMGDDEIHLRVLRCEHVDHVWLAGHIDNDGQMELLRGLAYFTGRHSFVAMDFQATKPVV